MTSQIELWLMARGQGMILVSPDDEAPIAQLPQVPPSDIPHLESVLPELADKLSKTINKRNLVVVHLHVSLPAVWQLFPWEGLTLKGRRLFGKVLFCRYASFSPSTAAQLVGRRVHVHSMWPDNASVTEILKPAIAAGHMRVRPAAFALPWHSQSWRDIWALAIVAHGSDDIEIPAVDELGQPWSMPPLVHWPPVVILLACGNDSSLIRHAERMLAAGARTVMVGEGVLDLQASLQALAELAEAVRNGIGLIDALTNLQCRDKQPGGVRHWVVCGRPPGGGHSRLDTWTLQSLLERGDLTVAPEAWREFHGIDPGAYGEAHLLDELKNSEGWPLTLSWSLPQAEVLAERYDPEAQSSLRSKYAGLSKRLKTRTPHQSDHALAQSLRRQGKHVAAMQSLLNAMAEAGHSPISTEDRLRYLFTLFDLLLDLHLPKSAGAVREKIRTLLDIHGGVDLCALEHHWLDRESAWHWRCGQYEIAYSIQRLKRDQAEKMGDDGRRELARLLWMAGWLLHPDTDDLMKEAMAILRPDRLDTLCKPGNDDYKFLFRSQALAAWRLGLNEKLPDQLRSELIGTLSCARFDPGAHAASLLIMAMNDEQADWPLDLALQRLADSGYLLEASYWGRVHGRQDHAARVLERMWLVRDEILVKLSENIGTVNAWLDVSDTWFAEIRNESAERCNKESSGAMSGQEPLEMNSML